MRKCRNKKNFWIDDEDNNLLKKLSEMSGRTQTEVIKKLIKGATIKEKPPEEFYKKLNELIDLKKEMKKLRDSIRLTKQCSTDKLDKVIEKIEKLRTEIIEIGLK